MVGVQLSWLEHCVHIAEVSGSNPDTPTKLDLSDFWGLMFFRLVPPGLYSPKKKVANPRQFFVGNSMVCSDCLIPSRDFSEMTQSLLLTILHIRFIVLEQFIEIVFSIVAAIWMFCLKHLGSCHNRQQDKGGELIWIRQKR